MSEPEATPEERVRALEALVATWRRRCTEDVARLEQALVEERGRTFEARREIEALTAELDRWRAAATEAQGEVALLRSTFARAYADLAARVTGTGADG